MAVVQPESAQQLSRIVSLCKANGLYIVPRGGGMSYTDSYLHKTRRGISIDMRRMNRIIDINTRDMIVTVECGCTWQKLNEALAPHGLRPPYWGPLSGMRATIGGALSQNSMFWGGTAYGISAESVIGLDVLLGNGEVLPVGAHGKKDGVPFMRYDGPDLTGLFLGDSGALGVKTVATLRLVTIPAVVKYASFSFETYQQICAAMSEIGRRGSPPNVMDLIPSCRTAAYSAAIPTLLKTSRPWPGWPEKAVSGNRSTSRPAAAGL